MRKMLLLSMTLTALIVAGGSPANAADYAFCLKNGPGPGDCKFTSYAQCKASLEGRVGYCQRNPGIRAPRS